MTSRERLHKLVEGLPEPAVNLAIRLLEALEEEPLYSLATAPVDDELDDEDFDGGLTEARGDTQPLPHDDIIRRHRG